MLFQSLWAWIDLLRTRKSIHHVEGEHAIQDRSSKPAFSPLTYKNPYIVFMHKIIASVILQRKISFQRLELVIIDAEENRDQDDNDIRAVLLELDQRLNYLLLVTDRPERYADFADEMYEENGLIVQLAAKSLYRQTRGNVILDFERTSDLMGKTTECSKTVYLPIYKRPWEVGENLDILVPVGYNTLVVGGILPEDWQEGRYMNERDRLDMEFRKG